MAAGSPDPTPNTDTPAPDTTQQQTALEARIDQLTQAIQSRGDQDGQLTQVVANLQTQLETLTKGGEPAPRVEPTAKFQEFYSDPDAFIKKVALEASREALGPHLANQAMQTRDAMLAQAKAGVDTEYGEGAWDEHLEKAVEDTLKTLPLEMQSSRQHFEAAVASQLGKLYLDPGVAKKLEDRRSKNYKAREDAMNMLPNGRPRPPRPDQLEERELSFLDSLGRSGIPFTKDDYKGAKAIKTIDDWQTAHQPPAKK